MAAIIVEDVLDRILQDGGYMQQTKDGQAFCVADVNDEDHNNVASLREAMPISAPPDDADTTGPVDGENNREPATQHHQQQHQQQQQQQQQHQPQEATGTAPANELRVSQRLISRWDQVKKGSFVYLKYYRLWHAVLVTRVCPNESKIKAIHYTCPSLLKRRIVQEDWFVVNPAKGEVWVVEIPREQRVSPEEAIEMARARVGQTGFNMFFERSSHLVQKCLHVLDRILQDGRYMQQTTDGEAFCVASLREAMRISVPPDDADTTGPVDGENREPATPHHQHLHQQQQQHQHQQQHQQQHPHEHKHRKQHQQEEATGTAPANELRVWQRLISRWDQVKKGSFVYLKYYRLWHAVLVTRVCPNESKIKAIHYACPSLLKRRIVQEDWFVVNPAKGEVWVVEIPREQRVSPEEAIEKARARVPNTFNIK